ncbi:MAG: hypothetical protein G01um10145_69 [Microgenomates group bacterium Gr01-1014_5]|nr:MAG: hypothetical protein G01um10145_69 [Microgenomates group bacterium Gr01-1014_5]
MSSPESLHQDISHRSELSHQRRNLYFIMRNNGWIITKKGRLFFDNGEINSLNAEFASDRVSFFGPGQRDNYLLTAAAVVKNRLFTALSQPTVVEVMEKFRSVDEDLAAKIAFILGGLVRYNYEKTLDILSEGRVKYVAEMAKLGQRHSGLNITIGVAMYILSGGEIVENKRFKSDVANMAEAIDQDPTKIATTADLGLSQTLRLKGFIDRLTNQPMLNLPDVQPLLKYFTGFPTVGAEFHFSPDDPNLNHTFWQRLALLNMSQYQEGSYIQMSRNDRGVIEVRMNPSVYPVTIANWRRMMFLLPELKRAFFTVTFNRNEKNGDFCWNNEEDKNLLTKLQSIGLLCYSSLFEEAPQRGKNEEIPFGTVYLGQTVRAVGRDFIYTGKWIRNNNNNSNENGDHGQFAIYAGYGDSFPYMAYYPSMALANPDILSDFGKNFWEETQTLSQVLAFSPEYRKDVFAAIENNIDKISQLIWARRAGLEIIDLLSK